MDVLERERYRNEAIAAALVLILCPVLRLPTPKTPPPKLFSPWILQDAYSEIAYLFAEFFRDLDIVPSDIIAGLVLLRQRQRAKRNAVLDEVGGGGALLCTEAVGISLGL